MEASTKLFYRTLSNLVDYKTCREKMALIYSKYACRQWFGNIRRQSFGNKFYCFKNFKAEFLSVRQSSTRFENVQYKILSISVALSLFNSSQKNTKLSNLVVVYRG